MKTQFTISRSLWGHVLTLALIFLVGCSTTTSTTSRAPVEDRGTAVKSAARPASTIGPLATAQGDGGAIKSQLGIENAGKPGYYSVKAGDTLIRISLDHGQNWRDLARWNQLDSPSRIEVGQVLRVVPPSTAVTAAVASAGGVIVTAVPSPGTGALPAPSAPVIAASSPTASTPVVAPAKLGDDLNWIWPTNGGTLLAGFDDVKNKGLDLGGKAGDAVLAAADGRVVYAGAGLRGYGNLIILKHNETFLSAYAHNQTLLVKEEQTVTKGQKIAEMGQSDSDKVKLHFEIRRQGKPVDPAQYLPKR